MGNKGVERNWSQEINLNDKLQKNCDKRITICIPFIYSFFVITAFLNYPVVRIGVALIFVILYGRKRLELKNKVYKVVN